MVDAPWTPGGEFPGRGTDSSGGETGEPDELLAQFQRWHRLGVDHWRTWRQEAREMHDIVAGWQWDEEDLAKLREDLRPAITFNRAGPFIDGVSGLEISNRQEAIFLPRQLGAAGKNELLTGAEKWARDECDAEDEESDAFRNMLISGVGATQTLVKYDEDPDGMIEIAAVDEMEILLDPSSRKQNAADARWIMREQDKPIEAAREIAEAAGAKNVSDADLDATWARDASEHGDQPHDARMAPFYRNDQSGKEGNRERDVVRLVEVEWWETETAYRVADPSSGRVLRLTQKEHSILQQRAKLAGIVVQSVRDRRRRYKRALVGRVVLSVTDGPEQGGFTYKIMTGKRDKRKGCWYGLVRPMRDPQQWANKWLSQVLYILNSNAKGGLLAEADAFEDPDAAEDTWSDPTSITLLASGGLAKIKEKPQVNFPAGIDRMMEFATQAIPAVTGFSPEMMGLVDRTQAGVVDRERKQQGMILFSGFFNSLRRYRKEQGRLMVWMIQTFISDGRLIRIGGPENVQFVPLIRDKMIGEYDVVVDDTPTSPNQKEKVWGSLVQLAPVLTRLGVPPQIWLEFLKYSPLPAALVSKIEQMMQQAMQQQGQGNPHLAALSAKEQAQARLANAQANVAMSKAQIDQQRAQAEIENKRALAIAALGKLGMDQDAQALARATAAMEALLGVHQSALAEQQQGHDQMMEMAQHGLAVHQAMQPPQGVMQQ